MRPSLLRRAVARCLAVAAARLLRAGIRLARLARRVRGQLIIPRVRRNAPCPCGSGRKHKNCHGSPTR